MLLAAVLLLFFLGRALFPYDYSSAVLQAARQDKLDPRFVMAVIRTESHFDPVAVSSQGAVGLMQIMPSTGLWLWPQVFPTSAFDVTDLANPATNIRIGTFYLALLRHRFGGDLSMALAAYNGGGTNVEKWAKSTKTSKETFLEAVNFPETRNFVERVWLDYAVYRILYPNLSGLKL